MKKVLNFILVSILCLSFAAVVGASKYNPYDDKYKYESRQMSVTGTAKQAYLVFDANQKQITDKFTIVYRDNTGAVKEATSDADARVILSSKQPGYVQILSVKLNNLNYSVSGKDAFEDFDYEDVLEGDVDIYVLQINPETKSALIYEAD